MAGGVKDGRLPDASLLFLRGRLLSVIKDMAVGGEGEGVGGHSEEHEGWEGRVSVSPN